MFVTKQLKVNLKSERKHFQSPTHNELEKPIHVNYTITNLDFCKVVEIIHEYINGDNKTSIHISFHVIFE